MAKKKNKMEGFSKFLNNSVDFTLVITVLLLLSLGLVMNIGMRKTKINF